MKDWVVALPRASRSYCVKPCDTQLGDSKTGRRLSYLRRGYIPIVYLTSDPYNGEILLCAPFRLLFALCLT